VHVFTVRSFAPISYRFLGKSTSASWTGLPLYLAFGRFRAIFQWPERFAGIKQVKLPA
jgi:hypothetical protein